MPFIVKNTVTATFLERVRATPHAVGFQYRPTPAPGEAPGTEAKSRKGGAPAGWKQVTFRQFHDECRLISFGLMNLGVKPGDRVAILSNTRYEWALSDMAILGAAAVTVPIYASNTADDVAYILNHSGARVVIIEDLKQFEKIIAKREALPGVEKIVSLDATVLLKAAGDKSVLSFAALREIGTREEAKEPIRFERNMLSAKPFDLITVCYTSGTTGVPKGVMLDHDNIVSVMEDAVALIGDHIKPEKEILVTFLPFSHIIGKVESLLTYTFGWRECYAESMEKLVENFQEIRPTVLFSVPRVFEKAHARVEEMIEQASPARRELFKRAMAAGRRYFAALWDKKRPGVVDTLEYQAARRLIFSKVREKLGGRLQFAVCGGAPLPREIAEFFHIVGIHILEGYGLTETSAPVTLNTPEALRFGTVGRPLADVGLRIAEDGEILVKSRKVFKGYYNSPEETAAAMDGGWFRTGDIGHIDREGFLHITDRKKDIIVTSAGKNIAPQKIENLAQAQKYINQFVVHGDRRNYLTALVTLDREKIIQYANDQQILFSEYSELIKNPKIVALVQKSIDQLNSGLASFETIKKFIILPHDFTVENGEMTPSLKVKRKLVGERYRTELDSMYAG